MAILTWGFREIFGPILPIIAVGGSREGAYLALITHRLGFMSEKQIREHPLTLCAFTSDI